MVCCGLIIVINVFGSGILEIWVLFVFLLVISWYFLGELLKFFNVVIWWCGDVFVCIYIKDNVSVMMFSLVFFMVLFYVIG